MNNHVCIGILLALGLGGCASARLDVPRAVNYAASDQQKARAAHHWDVLAQDVASRIHAKLQSSGQDGQQVYLAPPASAVFDRSFHQLLLTRLLEQGVRLSTVPTAVQLTVDTQVIQHRSDVSNGIQFPVTTLAAGVAVIRDLALHGTPTGAALAGVGAAVGLDAGRLALNGGAAGGPTRTEVLVSTSLERDHGYLARTSDLYYIEQADSTLYGAEEPSTRMKTWKVVGP
ncbi:hypothetical protein [Chromobacterium paludis]|uniref:Uncharacterized protein n=1 Tax=Chromobacterium paludis TaxID=2605945 RepID=A0A5C1DIR1_9NEIS|nr:hypothetical protein [Chromobacterium paludis]QEL56433.1 hypothetical protein FYK34_13120 [Chromobacterium paludis]